MKPVPYDVLLRSFEESLPRTLLLLTSASTTTSELDVRFERGIVLMNPGTYEASSRLLIQNRGQSTSLGHWSLLFSERGIKRVELRLMADVYGAAETMRERRFMPLGNNAVGTEFLYDGPRTVDLPVQSTVAVRACTLCLSRHLRNTNSHGRLCPTTRPTAQGHVSSA